MINRNDILSMEYLKKTEFTGSHQGMRYRIEGVMEAMDGGEEQKRLKVTVWPEPFNFFTTPEEQKTSALFDFSDDGVQDAVDWMNNLLFERKDEFARAFKNWDSYELK